MSRLYSSDECNQGQHSRCSGNVRVMDQDGNSLYMCDCGCHDVQVRAQCSACDGTGKVWKDARVTGEKVRYPDRAAVSQERDA